MSYNKNTRTNTIFLMDWNFMYHLCIKRMRTSQSHVSNSQKISFADGWTSFGGVETIGFLGRFYHESLNNASRSFWGQKLDSSCPISYSTITL
mmetsp:Transcript_37700/g.79479  ORF Transcript_37700/g.79479 Transcript_37700/m.79479 type:complete len:93 (+) Transcript_37700:1413-1691(+)